LLTNRNAHPVRQLINPQVFDAMGLERNAAAAFIGHFNADNTAFDPRGPMVFA